MKKDIDAYEKNLMGNFIKILVYTLRWLSLALCVINVGLIIGLLVMLLIKGTNMSNEILSKMVNLITYMSEEEALTLISTQGMVKTIVATLAYGLSLSINYGVQYVLLNNFIKLLKTIIDGDMYTRENVKMINDSIPLSIILAFAQPVIIFVTIYSTGIFNYDDINVSGVAYICVAYLLKLIFEKGHELNRKNDRYNKEISDIKAREAELKIETIKKEAEIKELKSQKKKAPAKVEKKETKTKKTTK